ncbi:MAG: alternative ribosome rescue aminoacyl-tRNA hydrolase ArfB [Anaerolineales bacterium]
MEIAPSIHLEESELAFDFIRASGPGGQNVNKVATAVQLRFNVARSTSLAEDVKARLVKLAGARITQEGILVIEAKNFRTQEGNRLEAIRRLAALIAKAQIAPKTRRPTRPGSTAKAARVGAKKRRGEIKRTRRYIPEDWE